MQYTGMLDIHHGQAQWIQNKKLSYHTGTERAVEILSTAAQLYKKSVQTNLGTDTEPLQSTVDQSVL